MLQEAMGVSAKGRICGVAEAAEVTRGSSPLTSELSTGKMNLQVPRWNKRSMITLNSAFIRIFSVVQIFPCFLGHTVWLNFWVSMV
uniref:Uncharacterized protein n=1 Tax=Aegilops tauschii subsp. strangulata TaxID=200361 RepID=A0A453H8Y0_AEGTS